MTPPVGIAPTVAVVVVDELTVGTATTVEVVEVMLVEVTVSIAEVRNVTVAETGMVSLKQSR
jgi:hypothetical protein